jgi:hypothetical protein
MKRAAPAREANAAPISAAPTRQWRGPQRSDFMNVAHLYATVKQTENADDTAQPWKLLDFC